MPETFHVVPCKNANSCSWDETKWYAGIENRNDDFKYGEDVPVAEQVEKFGLFPGFTDIPDRRYSKMRNQLQPNKLYCMILN